VGGRRGERLGAELLNVVLVAVGVARVGGLVNLEAGLVLEVAMDHLPRLARRHRLKRAHLVPVDLARVVAVHLVHARAGSPHLLGEVTGKGHQIKHPSLVERLVMEANSVVITVGSETAVIGLHHDLIVSGMGREDASCEG